MFERATNGYLQEKALSVKIEIEGGRILQGNIIVSQSASLREAINDAKQYLEFTSYEGKQRYISKQAIVQIERIVKPEEADQMMKHFNSLDTYNPYSVLGVTTSANKDEIRTAYHHLAKEYHPDRFLNVSLPSEAMQYMIAMSKRINSAYNQLNSVEEVPVT